MTKILSNKSNIDLDYPICRPSLDLDFTQEVLDPRITFSRGSIGTRVNRNRLIETVSANLPRFDYDPVTGECKGLLIEESRSNSLLRSEDFTTTWGASAVSVSSNVITAPDGNTTADKLVENTSFSSFKFVSQSVGTIVGTYTVSAFFKAGERFGGYIQLLSSGGNATAGFNLRTGTITGGAGTNTIIPYGNGWYRITSTQTFTSATASVYIVLYNSNGISNYTGDGTSGIYVWGAQLEAGAFPTSYIPTSGSTVTRSADNASMTGTNFSSWYNQSEGTLFAKWSYPFTPSGYPGIANLQNSSATNIVSITTNLFNHNRFGAKGSNVSIFDTQNTKDLSPNFVALSAIAYITNTANTYISYSGTGDIAKVSKNVPIVSIDRLLFGNNLSNILSGHIRRITYYPRALKQNQLQLLTQ